MDGINNDKSVTIAAAATISSAIDLKIDTLCGIYIPAGFTGTTITFSASYDATNYSPVKDGAGAAVSYTCAAGD